MASSGAQTLEGIADPLENDMLEWLKDKLATGWQSSEITKAAEQLSTQFEPIEKMHGAKPGLAERLVRYVFTGEPKDAVAELTAMQNTQFVLSNPSTFSSGHRARVELPSLVKLLPEDAELYLRLAEVYAATHHQTGTRVAGLGGSIPAFQGSLSWLSAFLIELSIGGRQQEPIFSVELLQKMIGARNEDPNVLIRGPFFYEDHQGKNQLSRWIHPPYLYFQCLHGFSELILNSPDIVQPAFRQKDANSRASALRALHTLKINPDIFAEEIASLAVSGSKEVREVSDHLVVDRFVVFQPFLERHAEKGSSDERYHAVRLLGRRVNESTRSFLAQRLKDEKSQKVLEAIRQVLGTDEFASSAEDVVKEPTLPAVPDVPIRAPLDKQVFVDLRRCIEESERKSAEEFAKNKYAQTHGKQLAPLPSDTADKLFEALQNFVVKESETWQFFRGTLWGSAYQVLLNFVTQPQLELIHLVRWCLLITGRRPDGTGFDSMRWSLVFSWREPFIRYQKAHKKPIDLRELAAVYRTLGLDDRMIGRQLLQASRFAISPFSHSHPNTIWPYFAERLDLLEEALGLSKSAEQSAYPNYLYGDIRHNAFGILKLFPQVPPQFVQPLWDLALGSAKTERPWAQECLENFPKREERIIAALASRQQEVRLAAAQWLGKLKNMAAIPHLRTALTREKSEGVKDELIKTLETLGVRLEELLDLDKLDEEAQKGLKKGLPRELEWFHFDRLPTVRWADSGKQVPPEIIHWFIVQGHKLKNAEANPILRRYCSLLQTEDREKLGMFMLESWIAEDTKPKYTSDQAADEAQKVARQMAIYARQYPQHYPDFNEERVYQANFSRLLIEPEGSQTATKGILSVAGACCGGNAAPIVHRYVKQWYGYRGAQSKALLQVLAWIDQPVATQVVLSVANRFRTKGIQEEAMRLCQMLAERKGWTLDELADRTIPTAGFDEDGTMELDYVARKFVASLADDMSIVLTNQEGKTIASLPDPNQSDDAEKAKQAKAALSNARKELKSVLAMQKERLYEALCTQRTWRFEDWDTYLRKHPIVGRYCQRLVWTAYDGDKLIESFRPLPDGSLTNHQDDEVNLKPEISIRLGHDETLPLEDRTFWLQHFSDYNVDPVFQQFGKQLFDLPDDTKEATEIRDFLGNILKAFSLRNRLTRQGYTRGAAQDAGWFFDYRKTFLSLGIEAIIEFSGNGLPEENRTVALHRLYFARKNVDGRPATAEEVTLGELPRVLLTECWNDIRMAAAEGTGFAEDWEKQTEM
jgi:hypothetical protein